jgi:hypothetical protein
MAARKLLIAGLVATAFASPALAKGGSWAPTAAEAEVLGVTGAFMAALNRGDADAAEALASEGLTIQVLSFPAGGGSSFRTLTRQQLFENFRKAPPRQFDELLLEPRVEITRDFAHVWAPYTLDINGKRIHCGIDSFGWMKVGGAWKLTSFAWTADPQGCPPK